MNYVFSLVILSWLIVESVYATSFGLREVGVVVSINDKPALCLPEHAKSDFAVGWVSLTESYRRNPPAWGASLVPGVKPLELKPGDCMVFEDVPEGYDPDTYEVSAGPLKLEVNRTYIFSLSNAYSPRDSYDATFCVNKTATGTLEYLQYTRLADGSQITPACDGKRNGVFSVQGVTGAGDK